jgi:hypothetical protein
LKNRWKSLHPVVHSGQWTDNRASCGAVHVQVPVTSSAEQVVIRRTGFQWDFSRTVGKSKPGQEKLKSCSIYSIIRHNNSKKSILYMRKPVANLKFTYIEGTACIAVLFKSFTFRDFQAAGPKSSWDPPWKEDWLEAVEAVPVPGVPHSQRQRPRQRLPIFRL